MKIFEATANGKVYQFVCRYEDTRTGFRHLCNVLINGFDRNTVKCTYQNKTWERYQFQSVINKAIDEMVKLMFITLDEKKIITFKIDRHET